MSRRRRKPSPDEERPDDLLSVGLAAKLLGLDYEALHNYVTTGQVEGVPPTEGQGWRVRRDTVESLRERMADEKQPHRAWVRTAVAAKELGVGYELLNGLISSGQVDGWETVSAKGNQVFFIYKDEVARLRDSITSK